MLNRVNLRFLAFSAAAAALTASARASIINGSFEVGDPTNPILAPGWTSASSDGYVVGRAGPDSRWLGSWPVGFFHTPTDGRWMFATNSIVTQTIALDAGDVVAFDMQIVQGPGADEISGWITYHLSDGMTIVGVRAQWATEFSPGWQTVSLMVPHAGNWTLILGTSGGASNGQWAGTLIDNVRVIPTPGATVSLAAFGALGAYRRRR